MFKYLSIFIVIIFLTGSSQFSFAQNVLTLEEAKTIALANSYSIQLSENEVNISQENTLLFKTGYKPTLGLSSGINGNLKNSIFKNFSQPESINTWIAPSIDLNVRAAANYVLWDAKRIDNQVAQNIEREKLAKISLRATKENIAYNVENAYLNVARMYENIALLEESIAISEKRKLRAQYAFDYGSANKLSLLNAEVDLNRDSVDLLKFHQSLSIAKRNLNLILNRDHNIEFDVEHNFQIDNTLSFEQFYETALANNLQLKQAHQNLNISAYDQKINDANLKPFVTANASYGINFLDNTKKNILDYSIGDGLRVGLSASWNLFDGGRTKKLNEISELRIKSQEIQIEQIEDQIKLQISNAWGQYQNALLVYHLEEKALSIAQENFIRTEERFKDGQINSIDFRQAQLNLLRSKLSVASAKFDAKFIELDLLQLSGNLLL
ncbi:MAG TPA: TolC family protein [Saprospiraceae bacterium]|nr:TolC family protein [Saprospiraceae bacterium]